MTLPIMKTYEDVESGHVLAYIGSAGTVEVAVRDGSAARRLQLLRGAQVLPATRAQIEGHSPYR
jgi:S-adenosylmethionine hydrolase